MQRAGLSLYPGAVTYAKHYPQYIPLKAGNPVKFFSFVMWRIQDTPMSVRERCSWLAPNVFVGGYGASLGDTERHTSLWGCTERHTSRVTKLRRSLFF